MRLYKNKTRVLIATHYSIRSKKGEDTDRRTLNYFKNKVKKAILITQPLDEFKFTESYINIYIDGKETLEKKISLIKKPVWLSYISHVFAIYYFLIRYGGIRFDICVACEDLSFAAMYPLRLLGLCRRLVYYTIDFAPQRFENKFMDKFYHALDGFACKRADTYWTMTSEMKRGRQKIGVIKGKSAPTVIVPIGYETRKIKQQPVNKIDMNHIIYVGGLRELFGVHLIIDALPLVLKAKPHMKLTFIGMGKEDESLKKQAEELGVSKHINFAGYVKSFDRLTKIVAKASVGLAPYKPAKDSFSNFSDPSKIKLYMVCGLPVITTNVTVMTDLIRKTKSGLIVNYDKRQLAKAIISLVSSNERYKLYKNSAMELSKQFDHNIGYENGVKKIPSIN